MKITPENSQNRDIRTMRTNDLDFAINDFRILSVTEEGYSVADADGNVYETVPDRLLPSEEYNDAFALLPGMYVDGIEKTDDQYIISLRGEDHTWKLVLQGSGDIQKWDRFMNNDED